MISVIICAKREEQTIGRAVRAFAAQVKSEFEIIVVAPDRGTLKAAKESYAGAKTIQDRERGKAMAMNLAIREAVGDKLIFSDGDVVIADGAVDELLRVEADFVTGRPISVNSKENMYGWWQSVLVDMADRLRQERDERGGFVLMSGYLFMAKRAVLKNFSFIEGLLTEDEYISYWAWQEGYRIKYAPGAKVEVKYPDNYRDWVRQKVRTLAGGYQIPRRWKKKVAMRSFSRESLKAVEMWQSYVRDLRSAGWMSLLLLARLDVWSRGFIKVRILGQKSHRVWQRVESTK